MIAKKLCRLVSALMLISVPSAVNSFAVLTPPYTSASKLFDRTTVEVSLSPSNINQDYDDTSSLSKCRRGVLQTALLAPTLLISQSANAGDKPPPIIPLTTTAKRLRVVPLFTIVDGNGIPFHTYDKDSAGGFGYFFTSYRSAEYVLDDARKAFSKAKDEAASKSDEEKSVDEVPSAWGQAQIVTLPLDLVMQLSVKTTQSVATNGKGKTFKTYYQVIPSTEDLNAALRIEQGQRYKERGRVPLFYVDGLTLPSSEEGNDGPMNPVYFRIQDLKDEWNKQYPDKDLPTIEVRELNETFRAMIRPVSGKADTTVKNLVFVPIPESVEKAKASGRKYKLGEMILTN